MTELSRRGFLHASAASAAAGMLPGFDPAGAHAQPGGAPPGPVAVSSANGLRTVEKAAELMLAGIDPLDAAIAGVNIVELDPEDVSVGYGGLPNEDGIVELDASVMHGPTGRVGSVAALRNIKTPSLVAKVVMERTDHAMLVGEGALRFARAHGFEECNLLTEKARKAWLKWKENLSEDDDWIPPEVPDTDGKQSRAGLGIPFTHGTISCLAVNPRGDIGGVTTTSGLAYKIPGRVGDSPIIGAGLFVDNKVGAAGATGRGEACIRICGSHTVVELMRHGRSPTEACLEALRRVVETTTEKRLLKKDGRPNFDLKLYALARDGRHGAAAIWSRAKYVVYSEGKGREEPAAFLFERPQENR